jgi:hypothetical protein
LAQLQEHRTRFDAAFTKAANNITEPGEAEVLEPIRRGRAAYYKLFDDFLNSDFAIDSCSGHGSCSPA